MHWFESQVAELVRLAERYTLQRTAHGDAPAVSGSALNRHRSEFVDALNNIVANVAMHADITACLVSFDGLVMAMSGEAPDFDALAAVTQEFITTAGKGAKVLNLGEVQQTVIVGAAHKVAVIMIGGLALCVLSPRSTNMSASLSEGTR